jgi:hypothetical protein
MPATAGAVQTFPANVPLEALQVRPSDIPPEAVAIKVAGPGAKVWFAGVTGEIVTLVGVTMQNVETTMPVGLVTVSV